MLWVQETALIHLLFYLKRLSFNFAFFKLNYVIFVEVNLWTPGNWATLQGGRGDSEPGFGQYSEPDCSQPWSG
jgi:hypothetical protein